MALNACKLSFLRQCLLRLVSSCQAWDNTLYLEPNGLGSLVKVQFLMKLCTLQSILLTSLHSSQSQQQMAESLLSKF